MERALEVVAQDGYRLSAAEFVPQGPPRAVVLIAGAMGVAQRYYRPFAEWLAGQGYHAFTFDYRGIGLSAPARLRGFPADAMDWVRLDCAAMVEAAARVDGPLTWLGHSFGGQVLPMVPNAGRIERFVMVASGNGYWRYHDWPMRGWIPLLWFGMLPLAVGLAGYYPGRALRNIGDLPAGVALQWRRWCLHPEYSKSTEGVRAAYDGFDTPTHSISFTDDEFMSARNIEELHKLSPRMPLTAERIAPAELGVRRIGHFGAFRRDFEPTLWRARLLPAITSH